MKYPQKSARNRLILMWVFLLAQKSAALDLSLPQEALSAPPQPEVFVVNESDISVSAELKNYIRSMRSQLDERLNDAPLLDSNGRRICENVDISYLAIFDRQGYFHGLRIKRSSEFKAQENRSTVDRALFEALRKISPISPFPETIFHGTHLIGIPSRLHMACHGRNKPQLSPNPFR